MLSASLNMLPKYRTIAQDVDERNNIEMFSRGVCRLAISHLESNTPGQVTRNDLSLFLKKEKDLASLHRLSTETAIDELFDTIARTYSANGIFEEDDLFSAICIRKRILARGSSVPNIRNVGGSGDIGSPTMPNQDVWICKSKK